MMSSTQASSSIFISLCSTSDGSFGAGARAAYEAEHLVPDRGHRYLVRGLDVQPQQRLGVGRAEVEPPAVACDGHPVEVVRGHPGPGRVNVPDPLRGGGLVVDLAVDLAARRVP